MSRISATFQALQAKGEKALVAYLMAGDPDPQRAVGYFEALVRGGADVVEIGVPFSDPVADGPVIQAAGVRALKADTGWDAVFSLVTTLRTQSEVPLVLMSYYNPIFVYGEEALVERCQTCGVDGLIVPDLPVEEVATLNRLARSAGVDVICLATPETPEARLERLAEASRGFLYVVGRYGVTGDGQTLGSATTSLIKKVRSTVNDLPLAVGFGLSKPDHLRAVFEAGADAAIVGSALVNEVGNHAEPSALQQRVGALKAATRGASTAPLG